jgi:hypothetical protein
MPDGVRTADESTGTVDGEYPPPPVGARIVHIDPKISTGSAHLSTKAAIPVRLASGHSE